ncbi:MAG TPA: DUF5666 domain-containing protein [Terriglobales bacterium]|nr:DUF5666 domain-containing protein [Terriglobales bacterium]
MKRHLTGVLTFAIVACCAALSGPAVRAQDAPPSQGQRGPRGPQGQRFQGTGGTITSIDKDTLVLRTIDGKTVTVKLTDATRYRRDQKDAKLADFKVGEAVVVRGAPAGENTWTAEVVAARPAMEARFREGLGKEFIVGEVKSIDGLKLTILRVDGQTQAIEVDENTSFQKQGESITLADIKPGDRVYGRGALKNGTFVPAVLNVGDVREGLRMGGPPQEGPPPR